MLIHPPHPGPDEESFKKEADFAQLLKALDPILGNPDDFWDPSVSTDDLKNSDDEDEDFRKLLESL
jgi:hypothetical protein